MTKTEQEQLDALMDKSRELNGAGDRADRLKAKAAWRAFKALQRKIWKGFKK